MRPPWRSMIFLQIAKPMPVPGYSLPCATLEHLEEPLGLLRVNADAVVPDGKPPVLVLLDSGDMNPRGVLTAELEGVADEVLQHLA